MSTSTEFIKIIQDSVPKETDGIFYQLSGPMSEFDPMLHRISNWFDLPPFEKALDHYISHFREENEVREEPITITYCYRWMLKGFFNEIDLNIIRLENEDRYLKGLQHIFNKWRLDSQTYLETLEKLNQLPEAIAIAYSTQIDVYCRAARGAIEVITEGTTFIDSKLPIPPSIPLDTGNQNNVFNPPMSLDEVRSWFIQLAENNSKNGNPFLTVDQVEQFIERAFAGVPFTKKLSMNEKKGDKRNVIGLFHLFYTHCITHKPKKGKIDPSATVKKYISLLTGHFDNWTFDEVKDNFRQAGNWKKPASWGGPVWPDTLLLRV